MNTLETIGLAVLLAANVAAWALVGLLAMILWKVAG